MSTEIIRQDPAYSRLLDLREQATKLPSAKFPLKRAAESGLAPSFLIARYGGGVGASTAAAMLALFIDNPLFVQIGGNSSRAFRGLSEEDRLRFPSDDPHRYEKAFDARLEHASRPAFIEFEQTLLREAITATCILRGDGFHSSATLIFVASVDDEKIAYRSLAEAAGIDDLIVLSAPQVQKESRAGVIRIPTLPKEIASAFYTHGKTLPEAIRSCPGLFSIAKLEQDLREFNHKILERLQS